MKLSGLISHLRAAWVYARFVPLLTAIDHEDEWTKDDAVAYTRFCNSPTGLKLRALAQQFMAKSTVNATQAPQHELIKRCGWSSGLTAAFTWLDGHLAPIEPETEAETIADEVGEFV